MGKKEFLIPSTNGNDMLHTILWTPKDREVIGVVQISHGMIEYVNRYDKLAVFLNERGFAVIGNDHLGHGKTAKDDDDLGYMDCQDGSRSIVRDLHRVTLYAKKRFPDVPYFLIGHSMGSFMARRYAMRYREELTGLVLMGTGYQSKPRLLTGYLVLTLQNLMFGERHRSIFMEILAFGTYNMRIKHPKSIHAWISSQEEVVKKYDEDPHCIFHFTTKGYKTLFDTLWFIEQKKHIRCIRTELPMLFVSGTDDPVGGYKKGVQRVIDEYKELGIEDIESKFYENARHEILNDWCYDEVAEDIYQWLIKHMQ